MYRYGLRRADLVVVQTRHQQELLATRRRGPSLLLPSALDLAGTAVRPEPAQPMVLWVGNILAKKRPLELLRIAQALPQHEFVAVGDGSKDPRLAGEFTAAAERLPNVRYLGRVEHADLGPLYGQATVLLNTSEAEGVPNTFLEAWARGVPVVSLSVDPDGLISREGLGVVLGTGSPAAGIASYMADASGREGAGRRARAYVQRTHDLEGVLDAFAAALRQLSER
jgi:glycosyltransferase involved in cell wall biosynthesis